MAADLEQDLFHTAVIVNKCKQSRSYCQNLYAALCNNIFYKGDEEWSCSWRYSSELISELINDGDYLDWYCSGMSSTRIDGYVREGLVTSEIMNDLLNLGWIFKPYEPRLKETDEEYEHK